jgi:hypothetical protein
MKKLTVNDFRKTIHLKENFKTTKEIEPYFGIIGQERALDSISTAMQIKDIGFNLYVSRKYRYR